MKNIRNALYSKEPTAWNVRESSLHHTKAICRANSSMQIRSDASMHTPMSGYEGYSPSWCISLTMYFMNA